MLILHYCREHFSYPVGSIQHFQICHLLSSLNSHGITLAHWLYLVWLLLRQFKIPAFPISLTRYLHKILFRLFAIETVLYARFAYMPYCVFAYSLRTRLCFDALLSFSPERTTLREHIGVIRHSNSCFFTGYYVVLHLCVFLSIVDWVSTSPDICT